MITVVDILKKARELVANAGWVKGDWGGDTGYCSDGALRYSSVWDVTFDDLSEPARDILWDRYHEANAILRTATGHNSLVAWNDDPSTTKADVLQALDLAIEIATPLPR